MNKVLRAKKQGQMKRRQQELEENIQRAQSKKETGSQKSKSDALSKVKQIAKPKYNSNNYYFL